MPVEKGGSPMPVKATHRVGWQHAIEVCHSIVHGCCQYVRVHCEHLRQNMSVHARADRARMRVPCVHVCMVWRCGAVQCSVAYAHTPRNSTASLSFILSYSPYTCAAINCRAHTRTSVCGYVGVTLMIAARPAQLGSGKLFQSLPELPDACWWHMHACTHRHACTHSGVNAWPQYWGGCVRV